MTDTSHEDDRGQNFSEIFIVREFSIAWNTLYKQEKKTFDFTYLFCQI